MLTMKICIYGSSGVTTPKEFLDEGYELGSEIAKRGHSLVFGGGDTGMMGAVASGVFDNGGEITSIVPEWIYEYENLYTNADEYITTETVGERKKLFLEKSDAFVIVPGGYGTLDEMFQTITLKYLNRHTKTIILFNFNHFYDTLIRMLEEMYAKCLIRQDAVKLFEVAASIDEIFELLQ